MKKILIADASKASLVMTSEVFKDHFPGVHVLVARTSADALEIAKKEDQIDAFVVDYDLPDKDGAYTAAKIKKLFSIPVLITAFDRPEVQENIERHCSAHDDCLSWLAKPVNSELVVSIAQRFIEGNYRTQRRIDCMIPAVAEITVSAKETVKKNSKKLTEPKAAPESIEKVCLPVMLEDCSVGGFKFRIMKEDILTHKFFKFTPSGQLNVDEIMTIFVPSFESIQTGEENVGYWLWGENKEKSQKEKKTISKKTTLSSLKRTTRQNLGDKSHEGQAVKGKVIWTTRIDGGDALIGVRSENMILSKKLFESILLGDNKIRARKALAETQKEKAIQRQSSNSARQPEREFARTPAVQLARKETGSLQEKKSVAPTNKEPSASQPQKVTKEAANRPAVAANRPAVAANKSAVAANRPAVAANKSAVAANKPAVISKTPASKKAPTPKKQDSKHEPKVTAKNKKRAS